MGHDFLRPAIMRLTSSTPCLPYSPRGPLTVNCRTGNFRTTAGTVGLHLKPFSYRRFAFSMAFVGQLAATIGLPMPAFSSAPEEAAAAAPDPACACCPINHDASQCCCCAPTAAQAPAVADSNLKIRWAGGVWRQRCLGPTEQALSLTYILAFPAAAPDSWQHEWALSSLLQLDSESPVAMLSLPETPPPRLPIPANFQT